MKWTTDRWQEVQALFHALTDAPVPERPRLLAERCGTDAELRSAVESLLLADQDPDELIDGGIGRVLRGSDPLIGQRLGAFTLGERIADGGMGSVYRAARSGSDFEQQVAIKVLRLGISTQRMRERFARERQTLARLTHPNVARLLDGGTTDSGIPFIAMELIHGVGIDRYCNERRASVRERLALFATVCRAVHFAHQNLVVHLDLKPSNILVDDSGVPKLVDFGVAGLIEESDGQEDSDAVTSNRPLTPEYASPEQLRGEPVNTATDVYALGVILYELLTDARPFHRPGAEASQLRRAFEDTEAMRPSARLAQTGTAEAGETRRQMALSRRTTVTGLARSLRGDLDRIVLMAIRHEPARRYVSCQQFADDIDHYLHGFPVVARAPTLSYRAARFVGRNRAAVLAAIALVLALCAGLFSTLHHAAIARGERDLAEAARSLAVDEKEHARIEAASSRVVASFLGETILSGDLLQSESTREQVRDTILRRAGQIRQQHAGDDHLRANVLDALGRTCTDLGLFTDAETLITEALSIRVAQFGEHDLEHALSLASLGRLQYRKGEMSAAAKTFRRCYELHRDCPVDVHTDVAEAANNLAAAERACGRRGEARELHLEALALRRQDDDGRSTLVAESLNNLAAVEPDRRLARGYLDEALRIREQVLGPDDPLTLQSRVNLAVLLLQQGDSAAAADLLRAAVLGFRALRGAGRDGLGITLRMLGHAELLEGNTAAALSTTSEALAVESEQFPPGHPRLVAVHEVLAKVHEQSGDLPAAVESWQQVLAARRAALPAGHPEIGNAQCRLGAAMARTPELEAAITVLEEALASLEAARDAKPADLADARFCLGDALVRADRTDRAEALLLAAFATYEAEATLASRLPAARATLRAFYQARQQPEQAARFAPVAPRKQ